MKWYSIPVLCVLTAGAVTVFAFATSEQHSPVAGSSEKSSAEPVSADSGEEHAALRLLDMAFEAAALLPDDPHVKNKARNQEAVVDALLELGQPARARARATEMSTWRRGHAFGALALHAARNGDRDEAERMITKANESAEAVRIESESRQNTQGWQRDRILARVAQAMELVDRRESAGEYAATLSDAESSKLAIARAERVDDASFQLELRLIDGILASTDMDSTQSALRACSTLYRRFYGDAERRIALEERFERGWKAMPLQVRIELTLGLAEIAAGQEDLVNAKRLVDEARSAYQSVKWQDEDFVTIGASIAAARCLAGEHDLARSDLAALQQHFDENVSKIYDVFRGRPLRAIAEVHGVMGDDAAQRRVLERALEEGMKNPNGRPRVDDFVATCCSMARNGFEPDAAMWERLEKVRASLSSPW